MATLTLTLASTRPDADPADPALTLLLTLLLALTLTRTTRGTRRAWASPRPRWWGTRAAISTPNPNPNQQLVATYCPPPTTYQVHGLRHVLRPDGRGQDLHARQRDGGPAG